MKIKNPKVMIVILCILALFGILLAPRENASGYDTGYPAPVPTARGYPAPTREVDPWCEEAAVMGMPVPWWCPPMIGDAVMTGGEPEETETPTAAAMKIGGRARGKR